MTKFIIALIASHIICTLLLLVYLEEYFFLFLIVFSHVFIEGFDIRLELLLIISLLLVYVNVMICNVS